MEATIQIALNALVAGSLYALLALGFNLIFSTARFFDIGYGALAAVGGYAVLYAYRILDLNLYISIGVGILVAGMLGLCIERVVYRPLRDRKASGTVLLVASLGVLIVIQSLIAIFFSSQFQTLSRNIAAVQTHNVFGGVITQTHVVIFCAAICIMVGLALALKYTRWGKAVRAIADDEEVARIVGINSGRVIGSVFLVGSAIAGIAGIAAGFDGGVQPTMGMSLLLKAVIAAIIGGIGNVYGGVLGAFLLAFIENAAAWQFAGEWKDAIAFVVLILFLLFRPRGILRRT